MGNPPRCLHDLGLGFRVFGFRFRVFGFRVLGFRVLGFRVWSLRFEVGCFYYGSVVVYR